VSGAAFSESVQSRSNGFAILFVDLKLCSAALDAAEQQLPRLSTTERERYQSRLSQNREDAELWRAAHIALRLALERYAGHSIREVPYGIEPGGRPRLQNNPGSRDLPHFSLAHAGQYALIAVSNAGPVGADLEVTRDLKLSDARRVRIEQAASQAAPDIPLPDAPVARFLQAWVRLEAIAKASGLGIGRILTEAGVAGGATSRGIAPEPWPQLVHDLEMPDEVFAALAGVHLPPLVAVEDFPSDAAGLQAFLASG
jgi:4'-phosphopantetheinyl transferase